MSRQKRMFSSEFREKAVSYVFEQDKSIAGAARELGIGESTLANWVKSAREAGSCDGPPSGPEREEIRHLRAENRELQMRVELLKKSGGLLRERNTELIFRFMWAEKANFPISFMAVEFGVSREGYRKWVARRDGPPGPRAAANQALGEVIAEIFTAKRRRYGAPRVAAELRRRGWRVGDNRVARLMAQDGLIGRLGRRWLPRTTKADLAAAPAANLVARDFTPSCPNSTWVTDITYLRTGEGWLYLAAIVDCYSRAVVGWATADHLRDELCLAALDDAIARRNPGLGLVHHSDRGSQYTSHAYQARLADHHMICSMSRKGNCWDNAVAESLWATIKRELVYDTQWATRADLDVALFEYIEIFYNRDRLHSSLGYCTLEQYDKAYWMSPKAA